MSGGGGRTAGRAKAATLHAVAARAGVSTATVSKALNGIAVSEDAKTIWMTATAPNRQGVVLRMPAFGASAVTTALLNQAAGDLPPAHNKRGPPG